MQAVADELEHAGHRRRMQQTCRAWAAAAPLKQLHVRMLFRKDTGDLRGVAPAYFVELALPTLSSLHSPHCC